MTDIDRLFDRRYSRVPDEITVPGALQKRIDAFNRKLNQHVPVKRNGRTWHEYNEDRHFGFSFKNEECQALVRELAKLGMSATQIGAEFGKTRNTIIGLAHRAKPRIEFARSKGSTKVPYVRRPRRNGNTLSTHYGRMQDRIDASLPDMSNPQYKVACPRCKAQPYYRCVAMTASNTYATRIHKERRDLSGEQLTLVEQMQVRRARRRAIQPRCNWHGCSEPTAPHKPYCQNHMSLSGHVVMAQPINFGKRV